MRNPFEILNVTPESSQEEIKRAYKNFVKLYHPDVYQGNKEAATEKMKELNWAYEALSDDTLFVKYANEYIQLQNEKVFSEDQTPDLNDSFYHTAKPKKRKIQFGEDDEEPASKHATTFFSILKTIYLNKSKIVLFAFFAVLIFSTLFSFYQIQKTSKYEDSQSSTSKTSSTTSIAKQSVTVFVTDTGTKYHRGNCSYLSDSKHSMSLDDAIDQGYTRCSRCNPPK